MMDEDVIQTMFWHSHNSDGTPRIDHCCGCWNIGYSNAGFWLRCNECGEVRDLTTLVDPDHVGFPVSP